MLTQLEKSISDLPHAKMIYDEITTKNIQNKELIPYLKNVINFNKKIISRLSVLFILIYILCLFFLERFIIFRFTSLLFFFVLWFRRNRLVKLDDKTTFFKK